MHGRVVLGDCENPEPPVALTSEPITVNSVSVTQCNEFDRCARRWFLRRARKVEVPPEARKKSAAVGDEIHEGIETAYLTGTIPPDHAHFKKVEAGVKNLPAAPGTPGILLEKFIKLYPKDLPKFIGYIDWTWVRDDHVKIVDHKTTSKFNERAEKPVDVGNDPQMLAYAEWAWREFNRPVEVAHNVISTTHVAKTLPIEFVSVSRDRAAQQWAVLEDSARKMVRLAAEPMVDWTDVPANFDACTDYGGCDFVALCALKNPMIGVPRMSFDENQASALLERLKGLTPVTMPVTTLEPVALLPPDAPTRMTPQPVEEELAAAKTKTPRPKKGPVKWEYMIDRMLESVTEEALDERGADGWELVGFHDGVTAVFKRQVQ